MLTAYISRALVAVLPTTSSTARPVQVANSYPTAILIRKRALVVNLEAIRMIICADQVLIQSVPAKDNLTTGVFPDAKSPFIQDLVLRLSLSGTEERRCAKIV